MVVVLSMNHPGAEMGKFSVGLPTPAATTHRTACPQSRFKARLLLRWNHSAAILKRRCNPPRSGRALIQNPPLINRRASSAQTVSCGVAVYTTVEGSGSALNQLPRERAPLPVVA